MRRHLVIIGLSIASLLFAGLTVRALTPGSTSTTEGDEVAAPVLSPRRAPELLAGAARDTNVRTAIAQLAQGSGASAARSCMVIRQSGRPVLSRTPDTELIPASTLKILTAVAALGVFGPDERFQTTVRASDEPENGVVEGSLYLVGGGDPLLFTNEYVTALDRRQSIHTPAEALADEVVKSGVRVVQGGVIGEHSKFDDVRSIPTWEPRYLTQGQVGPIDALTINQGFQSFSNGRVPSQEPAVHAAEVFTALLQARGVEVRGQAAQGSLPKGTTELAAIESPPIGQIVSEMLTQSDNTTAEALIKNIGVSEEEKGTTSAGLDAARAELAERGVPVEPVRMVDGSGLDRSNRASCSTMDEALNLDGRQGLVAQGLAVAGQTGTLERRMVGTAAAGRVRAKTGSLASVSALAGWADPAGGDPVSFVVMTNGLSTEAAHQFEDRLAITLATLPRTAPVDVYAPRTLDR